MGGVGPIPRRSIVEYARDWGITDLDETERFTRLIRQMDQEYMKHAAEQMKAAGENGSKPAKK